MYYQYFGLNREPFSISPDPGFLFPSSQHAEALAHLQYGLQREGGFILLSGEVGTGKTTLCRALLQDMPEHFRVAYIINARLDSRDLLASICKELGLVIDLESSARALVDALNDYLLDVHSRGERTLLVIEEAQNLAPDVLETLRLLTNLETDTAKLLHILLVGQPELLDLIHRRELRQLNQRVIARSHLGPLKLPELRRYLSHRLHTAGATRDLFSGRAVAALFRHSGGIPRLINLIADRSLLGAYAASKDKVDAAHVRAAAAEVQGTDDAGHKSPMAYAAIGGLVVALPLLAWLLWPVFSAPETTVPTAVAPPIAAEIITSVDSPTAAALPVQTPAQSQLLSTPPSLQSAGMMPVNRSLNLWHELLARWGLAVTNVSVYDSHGLCRQAGDNGLACYRGRALDLPSLARLNRPAMVSIASASGIESVLVTGLGADVISLTNAQGEQRLALTAFASIWQGDALLLWQPPPGYQDSLQAGDKNPRVVAWLQQALQQVWPAAELLITGGRYSSALAQQVLGFQQQEGIRADGVLGIETVIRINDLLTNHPRLGGS